MARLLDVLTGGDQKRDFKLLAKYFSAPGTDSPQKGTGKRPQSTNTVVVKPSIPPPSPRLLALDALQDGCRVRPARKDALADAQLPITVKVEFAYEGLDRDPFAEYDPLDFDLKDQGFSIESSGCTVSRAEFNELTFTAETPEFEMKLTGFDKNLRLRMRLTYEEAEDAATVDTE